MKSTGRNVNLRISRLKQAILESFRANFPKILLDTGRRLLGQTDDPYIVVWRASSKEFDVDSFLASHPEIEPDAVWHVGEGKRFRGKYEDSGFNTWVGDCKNAEEVLHSIQRFVASNRLALSEVELSGVNSVVDVGIIYTEYNFLRCISISSEALATMSSVGLDLEVTCYN